MSLCSLLDVPKAIRATNTLYTRAQMKKSHDMKLKSCSLLHGLISKSNCVFIIRFLNVECEKECESSIISDLNEATCLYHIKKFNLSNIQYFSSARGPLG